MLLYLSSVYQELVDKFVCSGQDDLPQGLSIYLRETPITAYPKDSGGGFPLVTFVETVNCFNATAVACMVSHEVLSF